MPAITIEVTELAEAIRHRLEDDDMTVRKAAGIVGVSPQTIVNWGRGTDIRWAEHPEAQRGLAKLLGVSQRDILVLAGFSISAEDLGAWFTSLLEGAA